MKSPYALPLHPNLLMSAIPSPLSTIATNLSQECSWKWKYIINFILISYPHKWGWFWHFYFILRQLFWVLPFENFSKLVSILFWGLHYQTKHFPLLHINNTLRVRRIKDAYKFEIGRSGHNKGLSSVPARDIYLVMTRCIYLSGVLIYLSSQVNTAHLALAVW